MNDDAAGRPHRSFRVIGAVALLWNGMGALNFFMQMNPDVLAQYDASARAIVEGRPVWATAGFALAVFGGTLGCVLLLFKKRVAYQVFIASLVGTTVTMVHTAQVAALRGDFGAFEISMYMVSPVAVAAGLIGYARYAVNKGWIR